CCGRRPGKIHSILTRFCLHNSAADRIKEGGCLVNGDVPHGRTWFRQEKFLMIGVRRHAALWALLAILSLSTPGVRADPYFVLAFDNATVQPAGPRPFSNGKNFLNIESSN